ncbi:MAG: TonB-dependent receptor, partial [Vicinamibacterales bacterium]
SEGDLASWIVAGSFTSRPGTAHAYNVGLSYSTQQYQGGNPAALAAMGDSSRNAGEIFGFDRWALSPWLSLDYGARYARYGYLEPQQGLLSPRLGFTLEPLPGTRVSATLAQRMVAPGAEEFLPRAITGPALPPERTFAPFFGDPMRAERARSVALAVEHDFGGAYILGIRRFYQNVDDQLVTMFRVSPVGEPQSLGHYYVANAGAFDASGWAVSLNTPALARMRGSIDYSVTRTHWISQNRNLGAVVPAALRAETEDIHDITTSLHTDIPETATRFYVLFRVNTAFTRANTDSVRPGIDGRFDLQVNQALPFGVAGTKWEVLVGVRNLFRDPADPASVYDELLVVRPPKRIIGGFLVRF